MNNSLSHFFSVIVFMALFSGCGRLGAPLPPERLAPQSIQELSAVGQGSGVLFSWKAPDKDLRRQELRSLDGYKVYRKKIENSADVIDPSVPYEELTFIVDKSLAEQERLREEARAANQISRKIKAPDELKRFNYEDKTVTPGARYVFKIVPVNQGGVEGDARQVVQVLFRGAESEISVLREDKFDAEIDDEIIDEGEDELFSRS